jgi:hypothetical protein
MSLAAGIFDFLSETLSVGDRVYPLSLPQGTELPAVTYQLISDSERVTNSTQHDHPTFDGEPLSRQRVQFNSYGRTYDEAEALDAELRSVAVGYRGLWGAVYVGSVLPMLALDDYEPSTNLYRRIRDLTVNFRGSGNGS